MRFATLLTYLMAVFLIFFASPALAGYCSGGQCLPGPVPPGQTNCTGNNQCAASGVIGNVGAPPGVDKWGPLTTGGLVGFLNAIFRLMIIIGGAWTLLNIIIAGYQFLSSGGKPESIQAAWAKIWQSLIGLLFVAGAFVLAAIFSQIIFGDSRAIIDPKIIGPK